jgi:transposase
MSDSTPGAGAQATAAASNKKHNGKGYDKEFKVAATQLVSQQGYSPKQAAASLGLPVSTLRYWIKVFGAKPQPQEETIDSLRLRLTHLEAENRRLKIEREILKKATAFFANQQP